MAGQQSPKFGKVEIVSVASTLLWGLVTLIAWLGDWGVAFERSDVPIWMLILGSAGVAGCLVSTSLAAYFALTRDDGKNSTEKSDTPEA